MKGIKFINDKDNVWQALTIPKQRVEEIEFRFQVILHDFFKPTKSEFLPSTDQIIKLFISLAENEQELVYCACMAGMKVEEIFGEELAKDLEENEE